MDVLTLFKRVIFMLLVLSAALIQNSFFLKIKILSETLSECQMIRIPIRTDLLSVLIWFQTVCKGYQQATKVAASKERLKYMYG